MPGLIVLDKPYISDFLINTLEKEQIPVINNAIAASFSETHKLNLISESAAVDYMKLTPRPLLYTNSENAINWIESHLNETDLPEKVRLFKNKVLFRELIRDMYPEYFFTSLKLEDFYKTDISSFKFPFIIKPAVGFFSLGVYKVNHAGEWHDTVDAIRNEIALIQNLYPVEVLQTENFIVEECIEGDEFAIDCYFNSEGKPIILNIMKHFFSSEKDVNDRVYVTSKEIIQQFLSPVNAFLNETGIRAGISNFPAHIEVRINAEGYVMPIEVNPLRFGGWCSTPDLAWYAFGINLYEFVTSQKQPDWKKILEGKEGKVYGNIVLNNSTGKPGNKIKNFDYSKLLQNFEKPLELRKTDYHKFPLFGFLFCETRANNMQEIEKILMSDLNEYISL